MTLRYDDPEYGGESMKQARATAREALDNPDLTSRGQIQVVMQVLPGGTTSDGPSEYVEAADLARELQDQSPIINCGACYAPEHCIAECRCRRV
jgi:hypothetical protein